MYECCAIVIIKDIAVQYQQYEIAAKLRDMQRGIMEDYDKKLGPMDGGHDPSGPYHKCLSEIGVDVAIMYIDRILNDRSAYSFQKEFIIELRKMRREVSINGILKK